MSTSNESPLSGFASRRCSHPATPNGALGRPFPAQHSGRNLLLVDVLVFPDVVKETSLPQWSFASKCS